LIDLDLLETTGTICPAQWEEDGSMTIEIPPECRQ